MEDLTTYPSILGGRVKTLHPSVFGGILARRNNQRGYGTACKYKIPEIDLVIVDLYPFEETVKSLADEEEIIEKIDIGGISLIRAAAKNYNDVLVVSGREQYPGLLELLREKNGITSLRTGNYYAAEAFQTSSNYDTVIFKYFNRKTEYRLSGRASMSPIRCDMEKIRIRKGYFTAILIRCLISFMVKKYHIIICSIWMRQSA